MSPATTTKTKKVAKKKKATTTSSSKKKTNTPKIRIKLKSYDVKMLESSLHKIVKLLKKTGADVVGPVPLPKKRKVYTVLKSTFKYKDSREQFERRTYSRLIDITKTGSKTVESLQDLDIPMGVSVKVKIY